MREQAEGSRPKAVSAKDAGGRKPSVVNGSPSSVVRRPSSVATWLFLLLFAIYLLSFSGRIPSSDGLSMFAVTESFVKRGDLTTDQMFTLFGTKSAPAPDGEVYSKYGYGTSLFAAPLYILALYVPFGGLMQVTVLACAVAVAITGALVYGAARRLDFSTIVSVLLALLFGLATPAWVYAKEFWSESFALVTLFGAFYVLLAARGRGGGTPPLLAGILLGLAIAVRTTNVLLVPLYVGYGFVHFRPFRVRGRALVAFLMPVVIFSLSVLLYNALRFGNPLMTGYRADEDFSNPIWLGAYGLLFSPGKGLFVYAPFLAALPFGVWQFWQRTGLRRELVLIVLFFLLNLILFAAWYYWWGGTSWAARFLVPTLPFLVLLCAPLIGLLLTPNKNRIGQTALTMLLALLVIISVLNELAGVSINSLTYRLRMVTLSPNPDWDAIFNPALSPLIGYWQILKPSNLDFAWVRGASDSVQFDWMVICLTLGFIAFCAWGLIQARRRGARRSSLWGAWILVIALSLFSMTRYIADPRLADNEGYQSVLQTLAKNARGDDLFVLNDDAHARYFLNANRTALKWYGLSRDPARWDASTQAVIEKQIEQHPRIWFAYDDAVNAPNPMRDWFAAKGAVEQRYDFDDGVHLTVYGGGTR